MQRLIRRIEFERGGSVTSAAHAGAKPMLPMAI